MYVNNHFYDGSIINQRYTNDISVEKDIQIFIESIRIDILSQTSVKILFEYYKLIEKV